MTNSLTVSAASTTGTVNVPIAISGTVSPSADQVVLQLAQQNTQAPTGAWVGSTTAGGAFAGTLTPPAGGTWYAWAFDATTGLYAVSGAISVPNPALSLVPAAPLSIQQAQDLLGTVLAGETPDELPAAAAASDSDILIVAQSASPKTLLGQTFAAIWTYIQTKLPSWLWPQVTISTNVNLTNSAHSGRILSVTASGVTITALLASLGPGFNAVLFNDSGSTVAVSGISLSTGTTIANGACVLLTGRSVNNTLTISGRVI